VCVFSPHEVKLIVDYVADSYYRHFEMYKCIYRPFVRTYLVQKTINNVDQPAVPQPLSDAFLHFEDQTIMS
jgi:hypothetical protein